VAWSCCQTIGLDTTANSIPYLTSWAESAEIEVLEQTAALTDRLCDRIESALLSNIAELPDTTSRPVATAPVA
jgi:hypothetical protein